MFKGKETLFYQVQMTMLHPDPLPPQLMTKRRGCKSVGCCPAGSTCGENIHLPGSGATRHSPQGLSAAATPRGDRAPSTCDRQTSRTYSWAAVCMTATSSATSESHGKQEELAAWGPPASGAEFSVRPNERMGEDCSGEGKQAF